MQNKLWEAVYELFQEMSQIHKQPQSFQSVKGEDGEMRVVSKGVEAKELVKIRSNIRTQLDLLRSKISENLTEREVYLVLFPIVVYFDEMVMYNILNQQHTDWRPLQKELFQVDNGGEVFYDTLDDLLRKPETLPFIYEIFYYCLSDGFKGKYANNVVKITEYKKKLKEKIPIPEVEESEKDKGKKNRIKVEGIPYRYYAATIGAILGVYFLIYLWNL